MLGISLDASSKLATQIDDLRVKEQQLYDSKAMEPKKINPEEDISLLPSKDDFNNNLLLEKELAYGKMGLKTSLIVSELKGIALECDSTKLPENLEVQTAEPVQDAERKLPPPIESLEATDVNSRPWQLINMKSDKAKQVKGNDSSASKTEKLDERHQQSSGVQSKDGGNSNKSSSSIATLQLQNKVDELSLDDATESIISEFKKMKQSKQSSLSKNKFGTMQHPDSPIPNFYKADLRGSSPCSITSLQQISSTKDEQEPRIFSLPKVASPNQEKPKHHNEHVWLTTNKYSVQESA